MKKSLLQFSGALMLSILGISTVTAEQTWEEFVAEYDVSTVPDDDGYHTIFRPRCGMVVGRFFPVIKNFKLGNDLVCSPDFSSDAAITVVGKNIALNLANKTVNCNYLTSDKGANVGIVLKGEQGRLIGDTSAKGLGKIINCETAVLTTDGDDEEQRYGHNYITRIIAENFNFGFNFQNDYNRAEYNIALGYQRLENLASVETGWVINAGSIGFLFGNNNYRLIGGSLDPNHLRFVKGNTLYKNQALACEVGFGDANIGELRTSDASLTEQELRKLKLYNVFIDNTARNNYLDGFSIATTGVRVLDNHADYNGNAGYYYNSFEYLRNYEPRAIFKRNFAKFNGAYGFAADSSDAGLFQNNDAFFNLVADFFDNNFDCSLGRLDPDPNLNRYIANLAFTAEPPCTRGS